MKCWALLEVRAILIAILNKSGLFVFGVIGQKSHNNFRDYYNSSGQKKKKKKKIILLHLL